MIGFSVLTLILFAIGCSLYGALVFWSGTRGFLWLAILVTLPAAMGGLMYLLTPVEIPPRAPFIFRYFGWFVVGQFVFGALVYWMGKRKARAEISQKGLSK